jgi:hypothetical protein
LRLRPNPSATAAAEDGTGAGPRCAAAEVSPRCCRPLRAPSFRRRPRLELGESDHRRRGFWGRSAASGSSPMQSPARTSAGRRKESCAAPQRACRSTPTAAMRRRWPLRPKSGSLVETARVGDNAEASVATYESAEIVPQQQSARTPSGRSLSPDEVRAGRLLVPLPRASTCRIAGGTELVGQRAALSQVAQPGVCRPPRRQWDAAPATPDAASAW